jgi:hypothetical protein
MVHSWIHLRNDRVVKRCLNSRVIRIFKRKAAMFYGDYDLDIYVGTPDTYSCLQSVVAKVIQKEKGWISNCSLEDETTVYYSSLESVISEFGSVSYSELHKLFPRKEKGSIEQTLVYRKDGNFKLIACKTPRFYYVFCFATS